jgi:hypothetical protein
MKNVRRVFMNDNELKNIFKCATSTNFTLKHGIDHHNYKWTYDITKEQQSVLETFGVKITEDYPHPGNGFTVTQLIVEVSLDKVYNYDLFNSYLNQ